MDEFEVVPYTPLEAKRIFIIVEGSDLHFINVFGTKSEANTYANVFASGRDWRVIERRVVIPRD